jgi:hypothetical protein
MRVSPIALSVHAFSTLASRIGARDPATIRHAA